MFVDDEILPDVDEFDKNELKNDEEEDCEEVLFDVVNTDDEDVDVLENDEEEDVVIQLLLKL